MIFQHTLDLIFGKENKRMTTRLIRSGEFMEYQTDQKTGESMNIVWSKRGKRVWFIGQERALQTARMKPALWYDLEHRELVTLEQVEAWVSLSGDWESRAVGYGFVKPIIRVADIYRFDVRKLPEFALTLEGVPPMPDRDKRRAWYLRHWWIPMHDKGMLKAGEFTDEELLYAVKIRNPFRYQGWGLRFQVVPTNGKGVILYVDDWLS